MSMKTGCDVIFPVIMRNGNRISCSNIKFYDDDYEVVDFYFTSKTVTELSEEENRQVKEYLSNTIKELVESEEIETFIA